METEATAAERTEIRPGLVLLVMCAGMFLVLLDVTVVNVAVPSITTGLRTDTAGVLLLPLFVPLAALSPVAGRLTARHGARPVMCCAALISAAGQLCLLLISAGSGYARLVPALIGVGIGVALFTAPVVTTAIRSVPAERSGIASGVNNTARQAGTALGVAVFGTVAGNPGDPARFVSAMRYLGIAAAIGWLLVAVATALFTERAEGTRA